MLGMESTTRWMALFSDERSISSITSAVYNGMDTHISDIWISETSRLLSKNSRGYSLEIFIDVMDTNGLKLCSLRTWKSMNRRAYLIMLFSDQIERSTADIIIRHGQDVGANRRTIRVNAYSNVWKVFKTVSIVTLTSANYLYSIDMSVRKPNI